MVTTDTRPPVLLIMGPTAAGKTALAVELVRRFPFQVISVDSAMVYRDMDIGTAKPDADTLRLAPHRLIDILDPVEAYSAARFRSDALKEMETITAAGGIPLLVGGAMLYYRALQQGLSELPAADSEVRARLARECNTHGLPALHARLAQFDPRSAARIHPHDAQRIQRALEVCELSGRPLAELHASHSNGLDSLFRILKLIVVPSDRRVLHQRIEQRFRRMLEQGFVAEVERLYARPELNLEQPSMRAVGYRQVWEYLDGLTDYINMVQRGVAATRQLAKRQLTWLRSDTDRILLDSLMPRLVEKTIGCLQNVQFFPK